jgi:hypothetical protein
VPPSSPDPKTDRVDAIVTLADEDIHRIDTVAKALTKKGFIVSHIMKGSGLIAGTAASATFDDLRNTEGVAALEIPGDVSLPTPGSDLQ